MAPTIVDDGAGCTIGRLQFWMEVGLIVNYDGCGEGTSRICARREGKHLRFQPITREFPLLFVVAYL